MLIGEVLQYLDEIHEDYIFLGDSNEIVDGFSSLANYKETSLTWIKKQSSIPNNLDVSCIRLAVCSPDIQGTFQNVIISNQSKHTFFSLIEHFYSCEERRPAIGANTFIGPDVKIGHGVRIGHNCVLDGNIEIGDNTIIWNNVSIINHVIIGANCVIQSGVSIGHDGFGYTENENHEKTMIKHFGGVVIGNHVLLCANSCVARGTIDDTVISDGVKIDCLCHIAHNCHIGNNSVLAFPCWLGGSVHIKNNGYVASGAIRNQITVGQNSIVGFGATVVKDVEDNQIVVGNPARPFIKK